jgi:hypothetical protein
MAHEMAETAGYQNIAFPGIKFKCCLLHHSLSGILIFIMSNHNLAKLNGFVVCGLLSVA